MKKSLTVGIISLFILSAVAPMSLGQNVKVLKIHQPSIIGNGKTLYVGGLGPSNYTTIQSAIDDAVDGDTVFVFDDSSPYYENVFVDKSINLIGEDRNSTIIDGSEAGDVVYVIADCVIISGFIIRNSGYESYPGVLDAGIDLCSNNNSIMDNNISSNFCGIFLYNTSGNIVTGNILLENIYSPLGLYNSSSNIISYNNISNNDGRLHLGFSCYNIITGNILSNNSGGIQITYSSSNTITDNYISNNNLGIYLFDSSKNILRNNNMINNNYNFGVLANEHEGFINDVDDSNMVNGKPIYYWINKENTEVPIDAGYVALVNCTNIRIENLTLKNNSQGILLSNTQDSNIIGNTLSNNGYGIILAFSNNNNIKGNKITSNNAQGIHLYGEYNTIMDNTISYNGMCGLHIRGGSISNKNIVTGNNISSNDNGIWLSLDTNNNSIYHNNFINNVENADDSGDNIWDDGKYGNYWSDYKEKYPDAKESLLKPGTWNIPYEIPWYGKDKCPLINQWPDSRPRTTTRDTTPYNSLLLRFLDGFPILKEVILRLIR